MAVAQPVAIAPAPATRGRRVLAAVALVVAVALLATWQVVARLPRLAPGEVGRYDLEAVDEVGGDGDWATLTDPTDGTYDGMWSFRNTGPVDVAVRVHVRTPDDRVAQNQTVRALHLVPVDQETGEFFWDESVDVAHVRPGGHVDVAFSLGPGCWDWDQGIGYGASSAVLDVTALGVTRTVVADAGWTATLFWTRDVPADPSTCLVELVGS